MYSSKFLSQLAIVVNSAINYLSIDVLFVLCENKLEQNEEMGKKKKKFLNEKVKK